MDIEESIKKAENLADMASDAYKDLTYREVLRYLLNAGVEPSINSQSVLPVKGNNLQNSNKNSLLPEAHLIAEEGTFKQRLAWAVLRLNNENKEGNVKNVQKIIDLELSLPEPERSYTSNNLASLVPKYLSRREAEEGRGYVYQSNSNTLNIFEDLKNTQGG